MKEPLDELLVQACAARQRADLAALEQLAPANVPCHLCRRCAAHPGGC